MYSSEKGKRWLILGFSVFLLFTTHYCTHVPAAIKDTLRIRFSSELDEAGYEYFFNALFSIYSLPNIILPFLNGYLVDKIGLRVMLFSLIFITAMGEILFTNGLLATKIFPTLVGRFIFGIGSESLFVMENLLLTKYFHGKELALAITINLGCANFGGVTNMYFTSRLISKYQFEQAIWVGAALCCFSLLCAIIVIRIDSQGTEKDYDLLMKYQEIDVREIQVNDIKRFDKIYWYLVIVAFTLNSSILCWTNIGSSYFIEEWYYDWEVNQAEITADTFVALMWLMAAITGPICGYYVDNYGSRPKVLMAASFLCIITMILFFIAHPIFPSILLGLAYSLGGSSIYPSISYIVPQGYLGKANGLITSVQNLGFSMFPYLIAYLKVTSGSYHMVILILLFGAVIALWFAFLIYKRNLKKGYMLDVEVDMMDIKGVEVLELRSRSSSASDNFKYQILNSSERLNI